MIILFAAGCAINPPIVSSARKESLRRCLAPGFQIASIPSGSEEDFYRVLEVFDAERDKSEFAIRFGLDRSEATVDFGNGGMHGGGVVFLKKKDGKWVTYMKSYNL